MFIGYQEPPLNASSRRISGTSPLSSPSMTQQCVSGELYAGSDAQEYAGIIFCCCFSGGMYKISFFFSF